MKPRQLLNLLVALSPALTSLAQSNIDPAAKYAWGENIGWINWRDAGGGAGVVVGVTTLSGFVWSENVGWIHLGDGSPANGVHYGNLNSSDFGVNLDTRGDLFGFAWGENIGWVNFDTRSLRAERARVDREAGRLEGFVWGENVGWIHLGDSARGIGFYERDRQPFQRGDANTDGDVDISDAVQILIFLFKGGIDPPCDDALDSNDDGRLSIADAVHTLRFLFLAQLPPPAPFGECGTDPTVGDGLDCLAYRACEGAPGAR